MSVESKIKELLERVEAKATLDEADKMGAETVKKDTTLSPANSGDASNPMQGSSEKASFDTREGDADENQGAKVSASTPKATPPQAKGAGSTPNFTTVGDMTASATGKNPTGNKPVNEAAPKVDYDNQLAVGKYIHKKTGHKVYFDGDDMVHEKSGQTVTKNVWEKGHTADELASHVNKFMSKNEEVESEDVEAKDTSEIEAIDLSPIFGDDLSEEFKNKATSIFEAAVIARVNHEMEKIAEQLEAKYEEDFAELREGMVEKIDSYLNYVVEQWMEENELALESGLRTEIAEDFISGLKNLFKEHYVEVPEERYDVIGELQAKAEELEQKLNEAINTNVELNSEVVELKRKSILEDLSKDLAATDTAKLQKLVEGIAFDNEEIYSEKVNVIKENYFPKGKSNLTEAVTSQTLVEDASEATDSALVESTPSTVAAYAQALSRSIKRA